MSITGQIDQGIRQIRARHQVDHFVAYTEHARREAVVHQAAHEARSMGALRVVLEGLLT